MEYFDPAKEGASMISRMIRSQTYSVDTISGATYSSKGLRDAVKKALAAAKN
ncbi:MAG: FMN-binding protein [Firmicutes bacterium]|nr:FMN-binding protein [Bacillota bacterium]